MNTTEVTSSSTFCWIIGVLADQMEMYRKMGDSLKEIGEKEWAMEKYRIAHVIGNIAGGLKEFPMDKDCVGEYERKVFGEAVEAFQKQMQEAGIRCQETGARKVGDLLGMQKKRSNLQDQPQVLADERRQSDQDLGDGHGPSSECHEDA